GYTQYALPEEGEIVSFHQASLRELGLDGARGRVEFMQGDIANLKDIYRGYDLILVDGELERSYKPRAFLEQAHERLNDGGLLVIASTYDWSASGIAREHWRGGFKVDGENVSTLDALESVLGARFERVGEPADVERVLRKTARSYQHDVAQV